MRLAELDVSGEHASLRWTGAAWELQDLHSRNGTFVDGRRLAVGERVALTAGAVLGLGRPESVVLVDAAGPEAFAAPLGAGAPVVIQGGILALPGPTAPRLMIYPQAGGWTLERAGEAVAVADGEIVRLDSEAWQLHLPVQLPQTQESGVVRRTESLRHEEGQGLPEGLPFGISEHPFRRPVPPNNMAALIGQDNGIGCGLHQRAESLFAGMQRLFDMLRAYSEPFHRNGSANDGFQFLRVVRFCEIGKCAFGE